MTDTIPVEQALASRFTASEIIEALRLHAFDDCGEQVVPEHLCNIAAEFIAASQAEIERLREALQAADYLVDRLQACLRGERVRDLDEAMSWNHMARAALRAKEQTP